MGIVFALLCQIHIASTRLEAIEHWPLRMTSLSKEALYLSGRVQHLSSECGDCTDENRRVIAESEEFVSNWIQQKSEFEDLPGMLVSQLNSHFDCFVDSMCIGWPKRLFVCGKVGFVSHGITPNFEMLAW